MRQEYPALEIIVVNDGSPTESLEALAPFTDQITILFQENKGQAAARNRGISQAKGEIIGLLDQDDLWPDGRLAMMVPLLSREGGYDFIRGMTQKFSIRPDGTREMREPAFCKELIGAALYKKSVFDQAGLFDESMRVGEDFDWNIRLSESPCKELAVSETTLLCRRHDTNQSDTKDFVKNGQMISLRKKIERMRAMRDNPQP